MFDDNTLSSIPKVTLDSGDDIDTAELGSDVSVHFKETPATIQLITPVIYSNTIRSIWPDTTEALWNNFPHYKHNMAASHTLLTGKGQDMLLVACSREIWLMASLFDFDIQIKHKPGELLILADTLSLPHHDPQKQSLADSLTKSHGLTRIPVTLI